MRKIVSIFSMVVFAVCFIPGVSLGASLGGNPKTQEEVKSPGFKDGELLVKFRTGISESREYQIQTQIGLETLKHFERVGVHHMKILLPGLSVEDAVASLNRLPEVLYAEPNYRVSIDVIPNDPYAKYLWGLHNIGQTGGVTDADIDAPEAWDIHTGSSDIVIAVIDTGVDYTHEDLADNMWTNPGEIPGNGIDDDGNGYVDDVYGIDAYNHDSDPYDDHSHGTHCSGTIGAVGDNGIGVVGVNWDIKIMAIKFLNAYGWGYYSGAIESLNYATMMKTTYGVNLKVTSNSYGGGGFSQGFKDAIEVSGNEDMLFVAAAGNSGTNNDLYPHYPSSFDLANIVAVAMTDHNDDLHYWSCYGVVSVDLGAPGVRILSTTPGNTYSYKGGTSMATPHVAGAAALLWAKSPTLANLAVKEALMTSVDPLPSLTGKVLTGGRLNVFNALPKDVSDSISVSYSSASFDRATNIVSGNCTIRNDSADTLGIPITLVVDSISDPSVTVVNYDGITDEGKPYFDFSELLGPDNELVPGETSGAKEIQFHNPNRVRFTWDKSVWAVTSEDVDEPLDSSGGFH